MQVPLREPGEETEDHPQSPGSRGALPARGHRHAVLLGRSDRGAGEDAGRSLGGDRHHAGDLLGREQLELRPRELEDGLDSPALDRHLAGGEAQRVRTGSSRQERAQDGQGEAPGGIHRVRPP